MNTNPLTEILTHVMLIALAISFLGFALEVGLTREAATVAAWAATVPDDSEREWNPACLPIPCGPPAKVRRLGRTQEEAAAVARLKRQAREARQARDRKILHALAADSTAPESRPNRNVWNGGQEAGRRPIAAEGYGDDMIDDRWSRGL